MMLSFPWARAAPARPRCASVGSKGTAPQPEGPAAQRRTARSGFLGSRGTAARRGKKVEGAPLRQAGPASAACCQIAHVERLRSEEHTSELQSLMRISYAVFCLNKKNIYTIRRSEH